MQLAAKLRRFRAPGQTRTGTLAAISIFFSFVVGLGAPSQAEAFSNAGSFLFGTSTVTMEDIAICSTYKYNFDAATTWNQTGYETCPSENLESGKFPATLHFKVRVQSIVPSEFTAENVDAFITDSKGQRVQAQIGRAHV